MKMNSTKCLRKPIERASTTGERKLNKCCLKAYGLNMSRIQMYCLYSVSIIEWTVCGMGKEVYTNELDLMFLTKNLSIVYRKQSVQQR